MIGWLANILILFGCWCVGSRRTVRLAFACQFTGNALWAFIGVTRYDGADRMSLIVLSVILCCLYVRNWLRWGKQ
jgi:hypothetical protein